MSSGM